MKQATLFALPQQPAEFAATWGARLLEEIPHPGLATAKDMAGIPQWPGRNHPRAGLWLWERYAGRFATCADPMFGVGALWALVPKVFGPEHGELERAVSADARTWRPSSRRDATIFSPPFLQNHSSGANEHQREIRESKGLHAMQEFGDNPANLGRMKPEQFRHAMAAVYSQVRTYSLRMVVILRNYIRKGQEVDEIGLTHLPLIRAAGWRVEGAHPRLLRPTGFMQWKVARDPETPWIRYEWAVVAR